MSKTTSPTTYGKPPEKVARFSLDWAEYMHYLYLPVAMPGVVDVRLPRRLGFLRELVYEVLSRENHLGTTGDGRFVYVTARRGYASPGNPLNRPGWHCDGFGTDDINYIWADRFPTRFATGYFDNISDDHVESAERFEMLASHPTATRSTWEGEPDTLYRLDPYVVHSTPIIPAPGGERSFLKISLSRDRYNLRGNSHNYLFDYDWKMWDRAEVRNDPAYAGGDAGPQDGPDPSTTGLPGRAEPEAVGLPNPKPEGGES